MEKSSDNKSGPKFTELDSLRVMGQMLRLARTGLYRNAIIFIVWGWTQFAVLFFCNYLVTFFVYPEWVRSVVHFLRIALPLSALGFTLYYLFRIRRMVKTHFDFALLFVWIFLIVSMVMMNLIQFNVLQSINFRLQHALFMVLISYAILVTGVILRARLLIAGGLFFALMAYLSSFFALETQIAIESVAWLISFAVPGHVMHAKYRKEHVS